MIIVAGDVSKESENVLSKYDNNIVKTNKCFDVYDEISYHTDIQIMYLGNNDIVIHPKEYDKYLEIFSKYNMNCIKGTTYLKYEYPNNIQYNGCIVGKYFVHNLQYTDKSIINFLEKKDVKFINVKQGYTKCNISIVNDNSIITSDKGIEKEVSKYLDVLYINPDSSIQLETMQGFIGGATGLVNNNIWCINGDINKLKECNRIIDFLRLKNVQIICLNNNKIIDIGSIIQVNH